MWIRDRGQHNPIAPVCTRLLLKESINCLTEGGSTAYVVLLDAKQAFDCVWIDGLFYQLYKSGLDCFMENFEKLLYRFLLYSESCWDSLRMV